MKTLPAIKMELRFLTALLIISTTCFSQPSSTGWKNLFNGKDLKGWKQLNGKAKYEVKDGMIVGTTVANEPNSFLTTEQLYGDFILELECKVDSPMNSGIQIRSLSEPSYMNGRVHGYQVEIDPSPRAWSGGLYDEARRGWLYPLEYNEPAKKAFKNGQWNKYRIECIGSSIRIWLNGVSCSNVEDEVTLKGFIALQVHAIGKNDQAGRQIRWRNIRIQTSNLKASPLDNIYVANYIPNNLSAQEKKNGVVLLWDGATSKGWRAAGKENFPDSTWKIKDGMLQVQAANGRPHGGDIVTSENYAAFELQFDFKLTEGANSGVKYFVTEKDETALGLEYQVLDDAKHPDAKMGAAGNRTLASLYDLIPREQIAGSVKKIGEWNRGKIIVTKENIVEHWLNGFKVVEYRRGSPLFNALVARSKYSSNEGFGLAKTGMILLQDHGNEVNFRSIKIRKLE